MQVSDQQIFIVTVFPFTVIGNDRLVSDTCLNAFEVRSVQNASTTILKTIPKGDRASCISCISHVDGLAELVVTGGRDGDVHLWDIDRGETRVGHHYKHMNIQACTCVES
jgi:WD40 repeat protein